MLEAGTPDLKEQLQSSLGAEYSIDRELDGGGMSRVFLAEDRALSRRVVVKVVPPDVAGTVNFDRFRREIQVAARLQHAHIVPVLTAGESDGIPYYTMPFVEGKSLRDRLAESGALPIGEAIGILRDVARALAYAHDHGVVHRDIKPDNVLVSGGSAVVTDFGIAKAIVASRSGTSATPLTVLGVAVGTPAYMSPEQAAGDPGTDHRSDIYSFGCLAFELLIGRPPFAYRSPQKLLAAHMSERPVSVSNLRPETPHALAALIDRSLEKDADRRPQSASELLRVLDAASSPESHTFATPVILPEPTTFAKGLLLYAVAFVVVVGLAKGSTLLGAPDWIVLAAAIVMGLSLPVILATGFAHHATRRILAAAPTVTPGGSVRDQTRGKMESLALQAGHRLSWRGAAIGGALSLAGLIVVTASLIVLGHSGVGPMKSLFSTGALSESDRILIGSVAVTNADTSLGPVVELGVRTQLGDSRVIRLVPEAQVAQTLQEMRLPPDAGVTPAIGLELAKRIGAKAVLVGRITGAGSNHFFISLRLVSADSGRQLTVVQASTTSEGFIDAIGSLARQLRSRIGESLRTVNATPPLTSATTTSLDALRAYTAGRRALFLRQDQQALDAIRSAVQLDSTFASAWRSIGVLISNMGGRLKDQYDAFAQAYRYSDRLPDRERDQIAEVYFGTVRLDRRSANRIRETHLAAGDSFGANNFALRLQGMRAFDRAEALFRHNLTLDSSSAAFAAGAAFDAGNLARVLVDEGKFQAADSAVRLQTRGRLANAPDNLLEFRYATSGLNSYRAALDGMDKPAPSGVDRSRLGNFALLEGRVREWTQSASARASSRLELPELDSVIARAWPIAVILDRPAQVLRELDSATAKVSLSTTWQIGRPDVYLATAYAYAGNATRARAVLAQYQRELRDTSLIRFIQPFIRSATGEILLAEHKPLEAIKEFRAGDVGWDGMPVNDCTICLYGELARAFDQAQMPDSAIAMYEAYMNTPYIGRTRRDLDASLLGLYSERLAQLYEAKGDRPKAAAYYQKFVDLWKNADPELQPRVAAARAQLVRLADPERRPR